MRFTITGGAGFIGSHLVEHLCDEGHDVVVVDDFSNGKRENLEPWLDRITLIEGSITDPPTCAGAIAGADYVFHEAALGSVPRSVAAPRPTHEANATGTLNVLMAARDAGVKRVVYAGSSSAYGNTRELPKREEMTPNPLSPYAVTKLTGEHYMRAFNATYGLETICLRYFNVFGPRQDPASQYAAVIPRFITSALENRPPLIFGDGEQTRDFTYVQNVVQANMLALEGPKEACGRVYNVGCGARISVNELWRRIRELTGATVDAAYEPTRAGDVRDSLAALENIREMLGFKPEIDLQEGLRRTVASYDVKA